MRNARACTARSLHTHAPRCTARHSLKTTSPPPTTTRWHKKWTLPKIDVRVCFAPPGVQPPQQQWGGSPARLKVPQLTTAHTAICRSRGPLACSGLPTRPPRAGRESPRRVDVKGGLWRAPWRLPKLAYVPWVGRGPIQALIATVRDNALYPDALTRPWPHPTQACSPM